MDDDNGTFDFETDTAGFDQYHAAAIDKLREADTFILAVPESFEEHEFGGIVRIAVMGGGDHFDIFRRAVTSGLARSAANDFDWNDDDEALLRRLVSRESWMPTAVVLTAINVCAALLVVTTR